LLQKGAKNSLLEAGVELEEFGGDVQTVEISALKVRWGSTLVLIYYKSSPLAWGGGRKSTSTS
jgi:hypothetical protein